MNTSTTDTGRPAVFSEDDLLEFELKVAQRADKLSQESGSVRGKDLEHWLRAEQEVLGRVLAGPLAKA